MERSSADAAIAAIPPRARVVLPHGCIEPRSLYDAIARSRGRVEAPPTFFTGLQFGDYAFLGPSVAEGGKVEAETGALGPGYRFTTWQVGPRIRSLVSGGRIGILPLRFRDIPRVFGPGGNLQADVAIIQCSPSRNGNVNLGISCSIFPSVLAAARLVIAEIHPDMPETGGLTQVPADLIDIAVDATAPLGTLARSEPDAVDRVIIDRVVRLIPEAAWVQLGVGSIPDAILTRLGDIPGVCLHSGMLTDPLLDFLARADSSARIVTGEVEGSQAMYERAAADPRVSFQPTTVTHDIPHLAALDRFISINSAIEIDLTGQVNGETIDGSQVSGVGGCLDFVEAARYSAGGRSVIALRSTARGRSRIVSQLRTGNAVTVPRFAADVVVTEHGTAALLGLDLRARAEALIDIAAPEARAELRSSVRA